MRKIKKINGFLVVKFNDREKREYEGTALGEYGVIDAEVYTGNLDIDRGAMEYDDADTLEVAVELARGLESEEDITDEPPTYTAAVETNESYTEEAVEPAALIEGWTRRLATQVKSKHYPDTDPRTAAHILREFGLSGEGSHIVNGHVPVRAIEGESPIKGGGRLIIIDGGFCRAYHRRTGIAGYTLVYNSRGLILRTHQPFESVDKAIHEDEDIASKSEYIYTAPQRILVRDTDEGGRKQALIRDLTALVEAYQSGVIAQGVAQEM